MDLAGRRPFDVKARATHVDPSRFGKFPAGNLEGDVSASGGLDPTWHVDAKVAINANSRLAGVPLSGTAHATVAARRVRDAAVDLKLASATLTASGSAGQGGDELTLALDAPQLADVVALLPARVPHPLWGSLHVHALMRGDFERGGLELQARGESL